MGVLTVGLGDRGQQLELRREQRNGIQQSQLFSIPLYLNRRLVGIGWNPGDSSNDLDAGPFTIDAKRNGTRQGSRAVAESVT